MRLLPDRSTRPETIARLMVGQVPFYPLEITVEVSGSRVDMNDYGAVELHLVDPDGELVDTSAGAVTVTPSGLVRYQWPGVTLFPTPGDYVVRVEATTGPASDWTEPGTIEVYREV